MARAKNENATWTASLLVEVAGFAEHITTLTDAGWGDPMLDDYRQRQVRANDDVATVRPGRK